MPPCPKICSIILAGGKGTRMSNPSRHKVCHTVRGVPVLHRMIRTLERCGIVSHAIVVGQMADQVMQCANQVGVTGLFCFQSEQKGTGHAARVGAQTLQWMGYDGGILIVAGDKVLGGEILDRLIEVFYEEPCDLAFLVGSVSQFPFSGRIVYSLEKEPIGNIEVFDFNRCKFLNLLKQYSNEKAMPANQAMAYALELFLTEKKCRDALGSFWQILQAGVEVTSALLEQYFKDQDFEIRLSGKTIPLATIEQADQTNLSVYLFQARALYDALEQLNSANAQNEEYLPDLIALLADSKKRIKAVPIERPDQVMSFNTDQELLKIDGYYRQIEEIRMAKVPEKLHSTCHWLRFIDSDAATPLFEKIYGVGHPCIEAKKQLLRNLLKNYRDKFGDEAVLVSRAPGRVNLLGRHIDHQGGKVNMMALHHDFYLVAGGSKNDDQIVLHNADSARFPEAHFRISAVALPEDTNWHEFINGAFVRNRISKKAGRWDNYFEAVAARWAKQFTPPCLQGMKIVAGGDIPIAAGLSSSSAIVVAFAEAVTALNDLNLNAEKMVELCGEAEWYVGTRGGAGDHAAMKFSRMGQIVQMGFFPLQVCDQVDFPENTCVLICNSHIKAQKTLGAREIFNHRVACYHLGLEAIRMQFPAYAPLLQHLRDLVPEKLGIDKREILKIIATLPVMVQRDELSSLLPETVYHKYLQTHTLAEAYPLRDVVLYGIAECERSECLTKRLREGRIAEVGRLVDISHDGDRVVRFDSEMKPQPFILSYTDDLIAQLLADADRSKNTLFRLLPGSYRCSMAEIDCMVDIARQVPGVLGAQIIGAGLGGCILVLAQKEAAATLRRDLTDKYYEPHKLNPSIIVCTPVAGSGVLEF